ncbi:MAG TPA: hypothetical protein VD838_22130, partial [Anaeromyxobacteraceae bacterium]|nr:hypothetical protein [Anaeromyxobacteraceae bacterium]
MVEDGSSTLEMAIAALLVVLGLRLVAPRRGLDWATFAAYAAAIGAAWAARAGLLAPAGADPGTALRLAGA